MKKSFLVLSAMLLSISLFASQKVDDRVLMEINGQPVTVDEFMYIYEKNCASDTVNKQSVREYLELFKTFKLKVQEAEARGLDTLESFRKELSTYRNQAVPAYMTDSDAIKTIVNEVYERMRNDRFVRHIAVRCSENATQEEENRALAKLDSILLLLQKQDFAEVARKCSEVNSANEDGGVVGWVTPFRYVKSFEDATYNTPLGQVSGVFRTPFGFHILKVEKELPHKEVRAAHIMKATPRDNEEVAARAKVEIDSLYNVVNKPEVMFSTVAFSQSDDKGSAMRGGDLGFFGRGQMVQQFEDVAFAMTDSGSVSKPFQSRYGWHVMQFLGERGLRKLDGEYFKELLRTMSRSEYRDVMQNAFIDKLKKEYNFKEDTDKLENLSAVAVRTADLDTAFAANVNIDGVLFSFADRQYTVSDFVKDVQNRHIASPVNPARILNNVYEQYVSNILLAYENSRLEDKYPQFRNLINEYHDGILLFDISMREVWNKASEDTVGLKAFFERNKAHYAYDTPHFKGFVAQCKDAQTAKAVKAILKNAHPDSVNSYIRSRINTDSLVLVKVKRGLWKEGENEDVDGIAFKKKGYVASEEFPVVFAQGKKLKKPECYTDVLGTVVSDYQDELQKQWEAELRNKAVIKVNEEILKELEEKKQ